MCIRFGITNMYQMILLLSGMCAVSCAIIVMQYQRSIPLQHSIKTLIERPCITGAFTYD